VDGRFRRFGFRTVNIFTKSVDIPPPAQGYAILLGGCLAVDRSPKLKMETKNRQ
jgi:hypothetical protein